MSSIHQKEANVKYQFFIEGLNREVWQAAASEKEARQALWESLSHEEQNCVVQIECIDQANEDLTSSNNIQPSRTKEINIMQTENQASSNTEVTEASTILAPQWTFETIPNEVGGQFLESKLGQYGAVFESHVFAFAGHLMKDYMGGFWELRSLPNGAFFYDLQDEEDEVEVTWSMNYFSDTMSAQAMSIAASVFALNILAEQTGEDSIIQYLIDLRDYACSAHPESAKLCRLFD